MEYADVFLPAHVLAQQAAAAHGSGTFTADGVHLNETGALAGRGLCESDCAAVLSRAVSKPLYSQ